MKLSDSITENNKVSIITDSIIRGEGVVYLLEVCRWLLYLFLFTNYFIKGF